MSQKPNRAHLWSLSQKSYICVEPKSRRTYYSRHVIFHEDTFPFENSNLKTPRHTSTSLCDSKPGIIPFSKLNTPLQTQGSPTAGTKSTPSLVIGSSSVPNSPEVRESSHSPLIIQQTSQLEMHESVIPPNTEVRTHHMTTRSLKNIYKPKRLFL